ncbi:hypothetical protein NW768_004178 [Fusarium equiseti]|uniref:GPI inositol-deacylase winged helix domain-containing protein n=1 Tax=Fusarium equiseti TaxID=61235 RepID=A0ABQ8RJY3_FUSEQ|nr:hypothetical protein NW768_004178 [Fusarium equiseti]
MEFRFLLASLQISTLLSQPTKGHLLELLRTFNKGEQGLDEHYGQAMRRIQDQEPNRKALAMKILTWIVHAERPLSMQELKHAVAVCENSDELDENYIPRSKIILSLCAGLVVLDEESRMVRLVHYTTQEYFERHENAWFEDAETEMIITCGTYLSFTSGLGISESFPEERLWPLYPYALYHWHHHVREIPGRASEWLLRFAKSEIRIPVNESSDFSGGSVAGLHLAAYFGLGHVAACLIDGGYCADEHDIYDRTPLSYAADAGRQSTINLLLATKDVDPNSSPKAGAFEKMTPLIFASINGHEAVVNLLLDVDHADIDAQDAQGNTALYHAVTCRNMSIVAVLIEKGPSMEINNNDGQTVLAVAAGDCNMDGVEILLRYGANPNPKPATGTGRTPLSSAARRGDTSIVRLLLATGADACLRRGLQRHTPPLLLAAKNDCEDVVEVLLQRGVDPEGVPEASRTPFSLATDAGNMTVAKPLFDSGKIDPDSKCSRGLTPLFYAACGGHSDIVKLLLDTCEVDPDINDSKGRTPLSFAASGGHVATVEILLGASGVDTDSKDRNGLTPLSYAAGGGRKAIVEMLLSASGVDPDSKDIEGRTPLSHAAAHGQQAIVELLLGSCRVDPNSRAEEQAGMTPLGFACLRGRLAVVKILLNDDRVDPDSKLSEDGNGGPTELFRAASHGREAILQLLLDTNRVDVNMTDKNGWTPLEYAKNNTIRRMLRDKGGQRGRDL